MANKPSKQPEEDILKILSDTDRVTRILQAGIHKALLEHKLLGNPICEWRDNKVVWIPPEEIKINIKQDESDEEK